jgi:ribonuclease HIII
MATPMSSQIAIGRAERLFSKLDISVAKVSPMKCKSELKNIIFTIKYAETFFQKALMEAGCDEAGRGCLAGPVFAAAVILPKGFYHELLNDSKQVNEKNRNELRAIIEKEAIAFAVSKIENNEIDTINILKASFKAMHLAIDKLKVKPGLIVN